MLLSKGEVLHILGRSVTNFRANCYQSRANRDYAGEGEVWLGRSVIIPYLLWILKFIFSAIHVYSGQVLNISSTNYSLHTQFTYIFILTKFCVSCKFTIYIFIYRCQSQSPILHNREVPAIAHLPHAYNR